MTERYYSEPPGLTVTAPPTTTSSGLIIGVVVVVVIVIILIVVIIILFVMRPVTATSTATTVSGCSSNTDCTTNQVCNTSTRKCVQCLVDANCSGSTPACRLSDNTCVACTNTGIDSKCPADSPICDNNTCVQCRRKEDCPTGTPLCNTTSHRCVVCLTGLDCPPDTPTCNPANNTCVQCVDDSTCTAPAKCLSGRCCDNTPPVMTGITSVSGIPPAQIIGAYSISPGQPQAGLTAVAEISDSTGYVLKTTAGQPANESISVIQQSTNEFPRYYVGYTYLMRVKVSQACGMTAYSNALPTTIPVPTGVNYIVPVIQSVTATTSSIVIRTSTPDGTNIIVNWDPTLYLVQVTPTTPPDLDPNRAVVQPNTVIAPVPIPFFGARQAGRIPSLLQVTASWPIGGVMPGQTWSVRVGGSTGINANVLSKFMTFTVG